MVRTRIAPSPTGNLHIGTARTALFNYLFAKKTEGSFLLRIEDTDKQRSAEKYETDIIRSLEWLGIKWDEPQKKQSERDNIYRLHIETLVNRNLVYEEPAREGDGVALVLKKPAGVIAFTDIIRGDVTFAEDELQDLVIQKPDGSPTYNFAVAIDDHETGITHVIRGEDHISNTPKQIMVYKALDWDLPQFAHLPLILAFDRTKLSKRHGAQSIIEFKEAGFLSEATINFLGLLGWHPKDEQEIFTIDELIKSFELEDVQKGAAVFDVGKYMWLNHEWINSPKISTDTLMKRVGDVKFKDDDFVNRTLTPHILESIRSRIHTLRDIEDYLNWFRKPDYEALLLIWKDSNKEETISNLEHAHKLLESLESADAENIENTLMPVADEKGRGAFLWPLRVALSGAEKSPGPFELAALLGKDESVSRIHNAIQKLSS